MARRLSPWLIGPLLLAGLLGAFLIALGSGYLEFTPEEILRVFWAKAGGDLASLDPSRVMALWEVRLPRILTSILAGAALALSGVVFQGLLHNPLADPYTLGVSSGAALGAALVITAAIFLPGNAFLANPLVPTLGAFLVAVLTLGLVVALARDRQGGLPPTRLILAGVILAAILSAALSFLKYLAGDQVSSLVFWLLGSFQARSWLDAGLVGVFLLPALLVCLVYAPDLNLMTLGSGTARTLGVDTGRVRFRLLAAASLAAAAAVAVAGIIGFVGLIVPHLVRLASGPDHRSLIPLATLGGGLLLLLADSLVRVVLPGEIPVGVVTALLAGPAFLVLFRRRMAGVEE